MKRKLLLLAVAGDGYCVVALRGVGTRITSLLYTITRAGFYYLTGASGKDGITVSCNHVTIDLMGFSLTGAGNRKPINSSNRQPIIQLRL